jgi:hypothetical protein
MILCLILTILTIEPAKPVTLESVGKLRHEPIREASGLVQSRRYPGIFWVLNDSGNPPALFAVERDGALVREYRVNIPNIDWEDVATDEQGRLYIGEIGNNDGRLAVRGVYRLDEPDPRIDGERTLSINAASYYHMPQGARFDAEALVIDRDRALIVAKTFDRREAEVYSFPLEPAAPLLRPARPRRVAVLAGFLEPVTGADLAPDGRLVVCSLKSVGIYQKSGGDRFDRLAIREFRVEDQIEAVCWDGWDIILAGEDRGIFRLASAAWREPASTSNSKKSATSGSHP